MGSKQDDGAVEHHAARRAPKPVLLGVPGSDTERENNGASALIWLDCVHLRHANLHRQGYWGSGAMSEARAKAWETRRAKYGPRGHAGGYHCAPSAASTRLMRRWLIRLHVEDVLSEGQAVKATGLDRVTVRSLADDHRTGASDGRKPAPANRSGPDSGT